MHDPPGPNDRFDPVEYRELVELLPEIVDRTVEATGRRPKLIYSVPDFSNPSGACMSAIRREQLVELAADRQVPVFEDDPYGRLRYAGEPLPNLKRLVGDGPEVIYASSFSKVLAPGVRVAWTIAAPDLIRSMVLMRQGEDLCTSTVTQALVAEYCRRGLLERLRIDLGADAGIRDRDRQHPGQR